MSNETNKPRILRILKIIEKKGDKPILERFIQELKIKKGDMEEENIKLFNYLTDKYGGKQTTL